MNLTESIIQTLQNLKEVNGTRELKETYEDRVQQTVNYIESLHPDGVTKEIFPRALSAAANVVNPLEMRMKGEGPGSAKKEFMKDVWKAVKKFKKNTNKDRAAEKAQKLEKISWYIEDAVGSTFPDGDPLDHLMPKLRNLGLNDNNMMDWLNAAAKKHLGAKSYYGYLAALWDDLARDSGDMLNIKPEDNPWK